MGLKNKNLRALHGKSLVGWAATIASRIHSIDEVVVSTDSNEIAGEAIRNGARFLGLRPIELSGPSVHDQQVLTDTLIKIEAALNYEFDIVVMLQPTSPLRTIDEVNSCLEEVASLNRTACWTISGVDLKFHFRKQLTIDGDSQLRRSVDGPRVVARQDLDPTFVRNGACYVFTRETLLKEPNLMGWNCGYVLSEGVRPNIDTLEDLTAAIEISRINQETGLLEERETH